MDMNEPFNRLKACRYGNMLYNKNDIYVGKAYDNYGEWKEDEINLFRQIIQSNRKQRFS